MNALRHAFVLLALLAAAGASAQTAPRVVVDAGFVSQTYSTGDEQSVSQLSVPVTLGGRLAPGVTASLRTVYASVSGDDLESLSGLGDTQLGIGYQRPLGQAIVDLSLTASLPTGQTALTEDQFATSALLAVDDFAFALPTFGQGSVVSPGLAIAVPVGTGLALGAGVAYASRSPYTLFESDTSSYAPANETILSVGLDAGSETASFTLEGSYVVYGEDGYRGETFSPGDKAAAMMRIAVGGSMVRSQLMARYRQVFDGTLGAAERPVTYLRPSQAQVALGLGFGPEDLEVAFSVGARYYGSIEALSDDASSGDVAGALAEQQVLLDLGVTPTVAIGPNARIRGGFTYPLGLIEPDAASALTGYRVGGSLRVGV